MIKLVELLTHINSRNSQKREGEEEQLVPVDGWKVTHVMYLEDMGFKNDGMFYYALKNPEIRISYKKKVGFILEDMTKKQKKIFRRFRELENYFVNYKQKWSGSPYS